MGAEGELVVFHFWMVLSYKRYVVHILVFRFICFIRCYTTVLLSQLPLYLNDLYVRLRHTPLLMSNVYM